MHFLGHKVFGLIGSSLWAQHGSKLTGCSFAASGAESPAGQEEAVMEEGPVAPASAPEEEKGGSPNGCLPSWNAATPGRPGVLHRAGPACHEGLQVVVRQRC